MFDIQNYASFVLAVVTFQLFPGVGTVTILKATASNGVKSGMYAVYGTLIGDFIFMSSAVLGLAAVLQHFPLIFKFAQYAGVFYLIYLGIQKLFENVDKISVIPDDKSKNFKILREALAVCLTNPKAILFFMAFFPLFLSSNSQPSTLVVMMIHVSVISLIYQTGLVLIGNSVSQRIAKWRYSGVIAARIAGIAFIIFGIRLAKNIR